jgi:hypothetical protein
MVILVGSRLECWEDGPFSRRRAQWRDGGEPVTTSARGSTRAAARRAPQGAKAELPVRCGDVPRMLVPALPRASPVTSPTGPHCLARATRQTARGALRAPLKTY